MLTTPQTLTIGAASVTLNRMNQDNFSAKYFGKSTDNLMAVTMTIAHTIPSKKGGGGESHLVRIDVESFDANGVYLRTASAWQVIKTFDGTQNDDLSEDVATALCSFLSASSSANIIAVLDRRS